MNHFGYNAKSTLNMCPKIPPVLKEKFISCGNIMPTRMSTVELWGTRGPFRGTMTTCSSQSTHNNLVGGSTPPINVSALEPLQSEGERSRATSNQLKPNTLSQQHMNEAYHSAKQKELDEKWANCSGGALPIRLHLYVHPKGI
jgi:hypothetical protein